MNENISIVRDKNGIPHIEADDLQGLYMGQGYVHAKDRGLQMLLMRILGKGRASELLDSGDKTLQIDIFFRKMISNYILALRAGLQTYLLYVPVLTEKISQWALRSC